MEAFNNDDDNKQMDSDMCDEEKIIKKSWIHRDKFANRFCRIQQKARKAAQAFNAKLNEIRRLDPDTARVSFLDCSIYYLSTKISTYSVVVETRLDGKFQKWNNNNGVSYAG